MTRIITIRQLLTQRPPRRVTLATMRRLPFKPAPGMALWALVCGLLLAAPAWSTSGLVTAQARPVTTRLSAYARIAPVAVLALRAAQTGILAGLSTLPGDRIHAGAVLARLTGPTVTARLAAHRNAVRSAQAELAAASKILAARRKQLTLQLSTQQVVYQAQAAVTKARAALDSARVRLAATRATTQLQTDVAGTVLAVRVASGERVKAGQTVLTVQPTGSLWLTAAYYGPEAAAVQPGMRGQFVPTDGDAPVPIAVRNVIDAVGPDGGRQVGMMATVPAPAWYNGESGTVTLNGPKHMLPAIPTRALILDAGRWWVLVHTPSGNRRRMVVPGPSRGAWTAIERGLHPGEEVVVQDAYLEFHRGVGRHYQMPD